MKDCARLYHCARCRRQVVICRDCDRGNIYCFDGCAGEARSESRRASGRRYQASLRGRHKHAERQRRYRRRLQAKAAQQEKVTQQGSPTAPPGDVLPLALRRVRNPSATPATPSNQFLLCQGCGQVCSPFVRLTALRGRWPRRASSRTSHRSRT